MARNLWQDPYAANALELLQDPARARAAAVRQIGEANARAAEVTGNAQANAQIQSGNAWAGAAQQIGQTVAAIPGQIQQAQEQSRQAAMQKLQLTNMQRQSDAAQRLTETKQQLSSMMQNPDIYGEDGTINVKTLLGKMGGPLPNGASGPTQAPDAATIYGLLDPINEQLLKARASANTATQHRNDVVGRMADTILQFAGQNPQGLLDNVKLGTGALLKAGIITPNQADELLGPMVANPDSIPQILTHLKTLGTPQKAVVLKEGEQGFDPNTNQPIPGMTVAPKPDKPIEVNPGNQLVSPDGKVVYNAPAKVVVPSLQAKSVLLDGKPAEVVFNPNTGKYQDATGTDVSSRVKPIPAASTIINPAALNDVKETVAGMKDGTLPPIMPGRATKEYLAMNAEAHRQGFDLQGAVTDWNATQKHIATLNGAQQTRLNQSINALPEMLDKVDALASQWKGGRFPVLNKANLSLAKGGAYGQDVASVANQLDAQIADVTADLGNVYMGGNSPTDHALGLASKSLNSAWDAKVLHDMVTLARNNVQIRSNSIKNTGVQGASAANPYAAPAPAPTSGVRILSITPVK